ncbi:DUF397 domain-containing protein [Streptomyces geranii]|uniref:DUF397 domain-containing protein n=1 Tax=Streptomyces geranii TaxID=2058923 RepID=UPI000D039DED|nr:DUF397 domain-containing protein [Streptomyces geranii]
MIRKTSAGDASELAWFKSSYSSGPDGDTCVEVALAWFKSSYSDGNDGESCVEMAITPDTTPSTIHIRDSKNIEAGPRLTFTPTTWAQFVPYSCR